MNLYTYFKKLIPVKTKKRIKKILYPGYKIILLFGYSAIFSFCQTIGLLGASSLKIKTIFRMKHASLFTGTRKLKIKRTIGIDARPLQLIGSRSRGIGLYTASLIKALKLLRQDSYNFTFYSLNSIYPEVIKKSFHLNYIIKRKSQRLMWLWNTAFLPAKIAESGATLFHATDPFCIMKPTRFYRTIATVYDVIPLLYPKRYLLPTTLYRRYAYSKSYRTLSSVDAIITISECSKKDIAKILKISIEKIYVTPLAADKCFKPIKSIHTIKKAKKKYSIHNDYILYVGGIDYRKNIINLLKAFALILPQFKKLSLVIVGDDIFNPLEPMKKTVDRTIRNLSLQNHLSLLGFIPTEDLIALYNGARFFVYPSLYEGFGLPILEAIACGCPVICSNTASLPEVAGNAAIYFDPLDITDIKRAMLKLLMDESLSNKLRYLGLHQAKKFSWEKTALETLRVYDKILMKT